MDGFKSYFLIICLKDVEMETSVDCPTKVVVPFCILYLIKLKPLVLFKKKIPNLLHMAFILYKETKNKVKESRWSLFSLLTTCFLRKLHTLPVSDVNGELTKFIVCNGCSFNCRSTQLWSKCT